MIIKINDKEYYFDGYAQPLQSVQQLAEECYQQGRADFIAEHTQINAYGKPFILISSEEYEQLKEQKNE